MADVKIANLAEATAANDTDLMIIESSDTKKITFGNLKRSFSESTSVAYDLVELLESGTVTAIKLIGDSITVGVAGGGAEDLTRALIGSTGVHEANITSDVWANFFRRYIADQYPSVTFFNAGIGGYSAAVEGAALGTDWYGTSNDTCFVMLGTNDRTDCATEAEFETAIENFIKGVEATCNNLYVLSPPPANNDYDSAGVKLASLNLTMEQIDKIISYVCAKNGWKHFSFYREFLNYQMVAKANFDELLETTGSSHPVASGYLLMWKLFQTGFALMTNQYVWRNAIIDTKNMRTVSESGSLRTPSTDLVTTYEKNCITISAISSSHADKANLPYGLGGILTTYRTYSDSFVYQEFVSYLKGYTAVRYGVVSAWYAWIATSSPTGNTANRPATPLVGMMYYDQTLLKPIWYVSGVWKDATGTNV